MAISGGAHSGVFGRRRHRRNPVMSEINVTPMVDVMLVLLIIFMVAAPLLTVGVPIDLPQTQAKSLEQDKEPLTVSINAKGEVYLQNSEIKMDELVAKLKAVAEARGGTEARIFFRGDKELKYAYGDARAGAADRRRLPPRATGDGVRAEYLMNHEDRRHHIG